MVDWVVDKGLDKLLAQLNAAAPGRSKASDGGIGDAAHAARDSDHNPEHPPPAGNPDEQVDARDFTQDTAHGADMNVVAEALRLSKDPRIKYVIWNRRFFNGRNGPYPWVWQTYTGTTDPHTNHMHVSVEDDTHDQTQDWSIGIGDQDVDYNQGQKLDAVFNAYDTITLDTGTGKKSFPVPLTAVLKDIKAKLATPVPVTVDATAVATALAADVSFVNAIADRVLAGLAARIQE